MRDSKIVEDGQLLPSILDHRAATQPERVWAKFPVSPVSYDRGFRAATYSQVQNAVNRTAWFLAERIGTSANFDTLAYLGPSDLRYHIVLLAAIKIGYKAFFPSPRNSTVAQKDLLSRLDCRVLVTTDPEPPFVSSILREFPFEVVRIPSLETLLSAEDVPLYPYIKTFEEARHNPIFALHTSGSTGTPKPMIYTHEFVWRIYKANTLPAPEGLTRIDDLFLRGEFFSLLPAFHIAGIGWGLVLPMFAESIPVLPLPSRPPSTDSFLEAMKYGSFDWAFLLPIILDELSKDPAALDLVASKLGYCFYTGGALPPAAGEIVSSKIPIFSGLGSSECAALPQVRIPDPSFTETWRYLYINPAANAEFRKHLDDLYELVIHKSADSSSQPVFALFPEIPEYETRDLFSPHPTIPNLWRHRGRRDDIIVFLNGEKTNPISFEEHVARHPDIRAALVGGSQRFEACLLLEPAENVVSDKAKRELIDLIWPTVEEANQQCPAHARISRSKILLTDPGRPMLRAAKGTVQREGTMRLYADEIDALYSETNTEHALEERVPVSISSLQDARDAIRTLVAEITSWSRFEDDADFFALGIDSLQILRLSGAIRSTLGIPSVSPAVVYRNPSVTLLAKQLYSNQAGEDAYDPKAALADVLQRYEQRINELSTASRQETTASASSQVVVLTGSTGTVGSFILDQLLTNKNVAHIYCLNRSHDSGSLQASRNRQRGLSTDFTNTRVTFLTVDTTRDSFGLDPTTYNTLLMQTTQIIHNAWPVDFNQSLQSFYPALDSLVNLISFANKAAPSPTLLFLSSISAVSSCTAPPAIPEEILTDLSSPAPMGYGEGKYLGERILHYASTKLSLPCAVCRIGQVAGTAQNPRGWSKREWLPSLILSSRYLKSLPDSLGNLFDVVDWVPVDQLAEILVEVSSSLASSNPSEVKVFHCVNPKTIPWSELAPVVVEELEKSQESKIVTVGFREWLDKLRNSLANADIKRNPAVKLVEFYEQLLTAGDRPPVRLSMEKSAQVIKSLHDLRPIQADWVRGWIQEWLREL